MATADVTRDGLMNEYTKFEATAGFKPNVIVLPLTSWKLVSRFGDCAGGRAPMDDRLFGCRVRLLDDAACPQELIPDAASEPMAYFMYEGV